MDKEDVGDIYVGILFSHQKMKSFHLQQHGTGGYYAKQNKGVRESQLYDLTDKWNSRNKTEDHRGREGKIK